MKKVIKIKESEIKRSVRRGLMENLFEQHEMGDTYSRAKYRQSRREEEIEGVFGQYGEEIPPAVLRYMRKNPKVVIKRLYDVYGQQMFDYISQNLSTPDVDIEVADEEVVVDETLIKIPADKYKEDMKFPEDSTVEITEEKKKKGKCPSSGCIVKDDDDDSWRIISNRTGKLWAQHYDTRGDAEDALQAYHANR